ncbi:prestin-like [Clavelina lepadiformis]|uniref:prestin-like n=1 Tax=Clavelina lepadiformis TaxID=159417 RepID=UPI004041B26D
MSEIESSSEVAPCDIMTDEQLLQLYGKPEEKQDPIHQRAVSKIKKDCTCSRERAKSIIHSILPMSNWLPHYKPKEQLLGDVTGGITVGIVHLPQAMAYGLLASLPPINGLYVSFFPVLIYAMFGTTPHMSVGTFAVISLMIGAAIDKHVPDPGCSSMLGTTSMPTNFLNVTGTADVTVTSYDATQTSFPEFDSSLCENDYNARKVEVAVALSVAVAVIHFAMYITRLGIITILLSSHMVSGFTCGAAFHVMTSQVPKLLGLNIPRKSGILALIYTYVDVFKNLYAINWATVIISACCIVFLMIGKEINVRFKKKLPFPLPWELVVVIATTLASQFGYLQPNYGVEIVGEIPQGIRISVPAPPDILLVAVDAIPIAIVIFSVSISLSRLFAAKHAYEVDANQELLAYAMANLVSSFFSCFPCASSLSRSVIWEETGGNTQITGLISSVIVLIILLWIGPLFQSLPQAALASIIVVNLKRMLYQFSQLKSIWQVSKIDCISWFVTWLSVVLLGVDFGLMVGVVFSLLTIIFRMLIAQGGVLIAVGETGLFRSKKEFNSEPNTNDNRILVFKFSSPLYYANKQRFECQVISALGFQPAVEVARRKKEELKRKKMQKKELIMSSSGSVVANQGFVEEENGVIKTVRANENREESSRPKINENGIMNRHNKDDVTDLEAQNRTTEKSIGKKTSEERISHLVLDMASCSFIDNDGVKSLKSLHQTLSKLNIKVLLAECTSEVRRCLQAGNFPSKAEEESAEYQPVYFVSVKKAFNYATKDITSAVLSDAINESNDTTCNTGIDATRM